MFLLTALVSLKRKLLFSICLSVAIFLAGFLHLQNAQTYPPTHISNFVLDNPQKVYVRGKVVGNPEVSQTFYGSEKTTFTFRVCDLKAEIASPRPSAEARNDRQSWQAAEGLIKVNLYGKRKVQYGDELLLQGSLERPAGLRNPGGFNYRAYLANHNIFGLLKVKEKDAFLEIASSPSAPRNDGLLRRIFKFKQKLHTIIYTYLEPEQAALLSAILLGERSGLSQEIKDLFIQTGTIHILAISGLHVGLIALILLSLFKFLRLPRKLTFILTIGLLITYAYLTGARASVVRATIMATVVLLGFLIYREVKIYNSLGLAALIILIHNPQQLFAIGFQLSFGSVLAIVYFAPKIEQLFPVKSGFGFYLVRAFAVSLAAWLGIAPFVALYFNIVTPVALLANLIVIPLLFLVVSSGIAFLTLAYFWPASGAILAQTSWLSLVSLTKITSGLAKVPFAYLRLPSPSIWFFLTYYAALLLIFNYRKLKLTTAETAIVLLCAANILIWKPLFTSASDKLTVTFLDVGHGDAIFIEFPYSQGTMLIDGGPGGENDAGRWVILPFLWSKGINKIDALVLTHPENDHVGGLGSVLKEIKVNYVFDNGMANRTSSYHSYKSELVQNVPHYRVVQRGESIVGFGQVELLVLHPDQAATRFSSADFNNNSVVLKLVYQDVSLLFCGDIQEQAIPELLPYGALLKSSVIKIPHHGSDEGQAEEYFLQSVSPQLAVITVDQDNRFGFPKPQLLQRLKKLGSRVYITGESGAIIVSTDGRKIWLTTMVGAQVY